MPNTLNTDNTNDSTQVSNNTAATFIAPTVPIKERKKAGLTLNIKTSNEPERLSNCTSPDSSWHIQSASYTPASAASSSQKNDKKQKIMVCAIDYDACLYNEYDQPIAFTEKNKLFLSIKDRINRGHYDGLHLIIASNRQNERLDYNMSMKKENPSVVYIMDILHQAIRKEFEGSNIHIVLNKFLIGDIFSGKEDGATYNNITEKLDLNSGQYDYSKEPEITGFSNICDKNKIIILYTQINKLKHENPQASIDYFFFDDRQDILCNAYQFFSNATWLTPKDTTLYFLRYTGQDSPKEYEEKIVGCGQTDSNYAETITKMVVDAGYNERWLKEIDVFSIYSNNQKKLAELKSDIESRNEVTRNKLASHFLFPPSKENQEDLSLQHNESVTSLRCS